MTQPNIGTGEGCPIEERIAILSKVRTDELRNLVALLRRKHAEWSQLPQLDNNDDRANEHLPPDLKKLWDDTNACEKDPVARHFNMDYWQIDIRHDCGFSGCAIGTLLTFDKDASNRLGLILEKQNYIPIFVAVPMKSGNVGFRAVEDAFGLPLYKANNNEPVDYLFSPNCYDILARHDPLVVADRIEHYANTIDQKLSELRGAK